MNNRAYYSTNISSFQLASQNEILGILSTRNEFALEQTQRDAWIEEIQILKRILDGRDGAIYLEFNIPRMGQRIDALLLIGPVIFVLEFKVGENQYTSYARDQVWDYALDLKNFHETSHESFIAPILVATKAKATLATISQTVQNDNLLLPVFCNEHNLRDVIDSILYYAEGTDIRKDDWDLGRYYPTPTIIEAAMSLYNGHSVEEISRNDAGAINLSQTSKAISDIIQQSKEFSQKSICFVTGVPGAGKTLVGLKIATENIDKESDMYSVFLSGNGPLVKVLQEALTRDKVKRVKEGGERITKKAVHNEVKLFIQNVHHFRDECLVDEEQPPIEHVALFDEAQRAWNLRQTSDFMRRKKGKPDFNISEPEFLISCLDRHPDWAVVVCLVGGGQEINTGEAGISEWIESLNRSFPDWRVYISPKLTDTEYGSGEIINQIMPRKNTYYDSNLHLSVSLRSFRAENVSLLIKNILDHNIYEARRILNEVSQKYPIAITRDLKKAKKWLKSQARGTERYGIVVSSQAERLKPHAIDVKSPMDPVHWFLDGKEDVRSSYFLEDVATEFAIQGLELDWVCVTWDADFRYSQDGWEHRSFRGNRWTNINKEERKLYQKNAYRVLLTRARQGMIIVVPEGNPEDATTLPEFYNPTFEYLKSIGFQTV